MPQVLYHSSSKKAETLQQPRSTHCRSLLALQQTPIFNNSPYQGPHDHPKWTTKSQTKSCSALLSLSSTVRPTHDNSSPCRSLVALPLFLVLGENHRDDEVAQPHSQRSQCQCGLPAHPVDIDNGWNCRNQHHYTYHPRRQQ